MQKINEIQHPPLWISHSAGLVDLHEKHILKYFLLREVGIKYCAGILEWGGRVISPGERKTERMGTGKGSLRKEKVIP